MMGRIRYWFIFIVLVLLVAACSPAQTGESPDLTVEPSPTTGPAALQEATDVIPAETEPAGPAPETATQTVPETALPAEPESTAAETVENAPVQFVVVPERSEVRYLVQEQLAGVSLPNEAIGSTQAVTGTVSIQPDGTIIAGESRFVVDMNTLQSDESRRDNYLRRTTLQTDQFPTAVFVPTQAAGLPDVMPSSGEVSFTLAGDLTIRDVTQPVIWDVTGNLQGDEFIAQAVTAFTFDDFGLTQPQVPVVLSVEDTIRLEFDVTLQRVSGELGGEPLPETGVTAAGDAAQASTEPALQCTSPAELTPAMTEGPYYKAGSPERTSLLEPGVPGTPLVLTGYVLTQDCQPVAGAWLDFWQTDGQGAYDNAGYRLRGHQFTDEAGRYRLETVVPGLYPGRTAHIHVKVQAPNGPVLTSQLFVPGEPGNESDQIFSPQLVMEMQDTEDGKAGRFDFVVEAP